VIYCDRTGKETYLDSRRAEKNGEQWTTGVVRSKDGKSIFLLDIPTILEEIPGKKSEVFSATTYVVYKNQVLYKFDWKRIGQYVDGKWKDPYADIKGNAISELPKELTAPTFRIGYRTVDKESGKLSEPIDVKNWLKK
jgi:hypothetical protein